MRREAIGVARRIRRAWPQVAVAALVGLLTTACGGDASDAAVVALTDLKLYDGRGGPAIADAVVLVANDTVACAGSRADCPVPNGATTRSLGGAVVTPGLVDAHVHVGQTGWMDGRPDGLDLRARYPYDSLQRALRDDPDRWYNSWTCAGITAAFDVGGMRWTVQQAQRDAARRNAPHFLAAGPLISHAGRDILSIPGDSTFIMLTSEEAGVEGVRALKAMGAAAVKVWLLAAPDDQWPEIRRRFAAVAAEARVQGLPLIVHATSLREAHTAVREGAHMLVHSVENAEVDSAFVADLVAAQTVYVPTLLVGNNARRARFAGAAGQVPDIDDTLGCVDAKTRALIAEAGTLQEFYADPLALLIVRDQAEARAARRDSTMAHNLRRLYAAGATIAVGTDAGNPLTLHGASIHPELEAMQRAGIPPETLVVMATRNGARAMRREDFGTLTAGKRADLLVLAEDPAQGVGAFRSLRGVMLNGRWLREPAP
ncbi:MAG: amidohydrolase family protein [Gemmatimonadaceae bacterium]|nr:amidohydrolase family protein [Gemmatimonadaceae bacterium]